MTFIECSFNGSENQNDLNKFLFIKYNLNLQISWQRIFCLKMVGGYNEDYSLRQTGSRCYRGKN